MYRIFAELDALLEARSKTGEAATSYTVRLLNDANLRRKKIGEEAVELVVADVRGDAGELLEEASDLLYHVFVLLRANELTIADVASVLESRMRQEVSS